MTRAGTPAGHQTATEHFNSRIRGMVSASTHSEGPNLLRWETWKGLGNDARKMGIPLSDVMTQIVSICMEQTDVATRCQSELRDILSGPALSAVAEGFYGNDVGSTPESSEKQLLQLRALHQIGRAATASSHPKELLDIAMNVIAEATGSDATAVFLFDQSSEILALWAAKGLNHSSIGALNVSLSEGLTGLAATRREPVVEKHAKDHPSWITRENLGDTAYASQASIPMLLESQDKLVGVLNVLTAESRTFTNDDVDFLQTVANELAVSVEFARIHDQTDEKLEKTIAELGTLQRLSRVVASSLSVSDVLRLISESAAEISDAEATALFRMQPHRSGVGASQNPVIEHRVGQPRQASDLTQRDEFVRRVIETGTASTMVLDYVDGPSRLYGFPLRSARDIWGALCVRLRPGKLLSREQLGLLQAFTDFGSIAIENAELFEEARKSAAVSETLLQEMHHRVRNNLQTLAALLSLQMRQIDNEETLRHLREAASRVQSIGAVHDLLSDEERLGGTTIQAVAGLVVEEARSTLVPPDVDVKFIVMPDTITVSSRTATILALLINELIANAITHGFRQRKAGTITISAGWKDGRVLLIVSNDGEQVPEGFNASMSSGLGLRIVERLTEFDLGGQFEIERTDEGTRATIWFPLPS